MSSRPFVSTATCRLRPTILLARSYPLLGKGGFDSLAVQHVAGWARFTACLLPVDHERHIVDRAEQQTNEAPKSPVHHLPGTELAWQPPPAARATGHVPDCVQDFAKVEGRFAPARRRLGHRRRDPLPLGVGQVRQVPPGFACDAGQPASALSGPQPKLQSQPDAPQQPFLNGHLKS